MTEPTFGSHLIYDGECPFCSQYALLARIREAAGPVGLINARDGAPECARAQHLGYDLNEGMLLHLDGRDYFGADCLNMLALLSTQSGFFNRLNALVFQRPTVARVCYPLMRMGRNITLRILGRSKIV